MAPKRRKLSLEENESSSRDVKRLECLNLDADNKQSNMCLEQDKCEEIIDKQTSSKSLTEIYTDIKTKDDNPKPVRISERLSIKRNRLGEPEETENVNQPPLKGQTPKKPKTTKQQSKRTKKKIRRPWAQWSVRDKKLFFIGLGEFGKNFEAISNKISHAAKMRGFPLKDKMQVRYFYYRIWAKISKFVHMKDSGVKMKTQELYGLINYGALKKYVKETDPQFERCLNELILYGETSFVFRGRRQRETSCIPKGRRPRVGKVRTPICTYLKKLNRIEASESSGTNKLPNHITLELTPKNSKAWSKVQSLAQNPRIRVKLTANRTLESVFKYLDKKWKPHRVRLKEGFGVSEVPGEELIFYLHPSCKLKPVAIIPQEQQRIDVTFKSYRENILPTLRNKKRPRASKESDKRIEEKEKASEEIPDDPGGFGKVDRNSTSNPKESNFVSDYQNNKISNDVPPAFANLISTGASDVSSIAQNIGLDCLADTPVGVTPPSVLHEDENAMFPDHAPFSPPISSISTAQNINSSVIISSPPPSMSSALSPTSVNRRKITKASKKLALVDEVKPASNSCDNPVSLSDNSSSPAKNEGTSISVQDLKEESDREIARLTKLVGEGFTQKNSNNVTLLHLSILLGRENIIKLDYEWREKNPSKLPPLLCKASNQMSNLLRRLCNIAAVELSDYSKPLEKLVDQNKPPSKSVPCSHCGSDVALKSGSRSSRRQMKVDRKERTRETATMTDPQNLDLNITQAQIFQPLPGLTPGTRTFVAGPPPGAVQINGSDPVFRVPFVPTFKNLCAKDDQQKYEEQQRLQQQAKEIMQQAPSPRRLLKKRTMSRKTSSSIIVQRSLVPKVDTGEIVTLIQPSPRAIQRSLVVRVGPEELMKSAQAVNIICSTPLSKSEDNDQMKVSEGRAIPEEAILTATTKASELCSLWDDKSEAWSLEHSVFAQHGEVVTTRNLANSTVLIPLDVKNNIQLDDKSFLSSISVSTTPTTVFLNKTSSPKLLTPATIAQGDLSISDFNISMTSVSGGSMGPDAGDRFLDLLLQNSEQGFSGLLQTPKKSSQYSEGEHSEITDAEMCFGTPILRTPSLSGVPTSTSFLNTPNEFPSPLKEPNEQQWLTSDDVSLSSILGDSSSFKTQNHTNFTNISLGNEKYAATSTPSAAYTSFFDAESSNTSEPGLDSYSKPLESVTDDISLSSLLGNPSFKKEDLQRTSPLLPLSKLKPVNLFSTSLDLEGHSQLFGEGSEDSIAKLDVEGLVNESSFDFVSKFESLAAQISERQESLSVTEKQEKLLAGMDLIRMESPSTES
ncbi:unnamed protein product [Lymnaea stagnalis]|uniref:Protein cramped-like n=1 Tax=Lymnaea stagnalis TaxID=6523 RepID=A0AAV2GZP8_LYMST